MGLDTSQTTSLIFLLIFLKICWKSLKDSHDWNDAQPEKILNTASRNSFELFLTLLAIVSGFKFLSATNLYAQRFMFHNNNKKRNTFRDLWHMMLWFHRDGIQLCIYFYGNSKQFFHEISQTFTSVQKRNNESIFYRQFANQIETFSGAVRKALSKGWKLRKINKDLQLFNHFIKKDFRMENEWKEFSKLKTFSSIFLISNPDWNTDRPHISKQWSLIVFRDFSLIVSLLKEF